MSRSFKASSLYIPVVLAILSLRAEHSSTSNHTNPRQRLPTLVFSAPTMATQLKVLVTGNSQVFRRAERGVLHIQISHTSPSQSDVSSTVARKSDTLTTLFRQHALKLEDNVPHPNAGITTFTLSAPSTSSHLPINPDTGRVLPDGAKQYTAQTAAEVVFRDLDLLARLATELSAMENVAIADTEWRLTDTTRAEITREARIGAVRNAVEKANDYADVVGRQVVAYHIDDGNVSTSFSRPAKQTAYRGGGTFYQAQQMQVPPMQAYGSPSAGGGRVAEGPPSLEPATITVSANCNLKFASPDGKAIVGDVEDDF